MCEKQASSFDYSPGHLSAVEAAISIERLQPYVVETGGDKEKALRRYERNTRLSEALYGPLQGVEIVIRNAFNIQLTKSFGAQWFDVLEKTGVLEFEQVEKLTGAREALKRKGKPETPGRIVSELSFGFWTGICARRYSAPLWMPSLRNPFMPHRLARVDVFDRLDGIRALRNRVAHHEPILARDLEGDFAGIISAIGWICGASAKWVESTSCFRERYASP